MITLISRITSKAVQSAVKSITMTATQKTVATVASKAVIATATAAGAMVINTKIQQKEADKISKKASDSLVAHEENAENPIMTEDEIIKASKKAQTKANVSSGAVIGIGTAAQTLVDIGIKMI